MIKGNQLLYFQVVALLALPFLFIYGTTIDFVLCFVVHVIMNLFGQVITYHRTITHKACVLPRWAFLLGNTAAILAGLGTGLSWAANHLQHHRFSDTDKDPHSPLFHSKWHIYTHSMRSDINMKYSASLLRNKTLVWFHNNFWNIHGVYIAVLLAVYPFGIISMYLAPASILWAISCAFNIYCHLYGYRNFETKDHSTNNWLISLLAFGEGWHNNHHKYPGNYTTQVKWWEIDLAGLVIKLIRKKEVNELNK